MGQRGSSTRAVGRNIQVYAFNTAQFTYRMTYVSTVSLDGAHTKTVTLNKLGNGSFNIIVDASVNGNPISTAITIETLKGDTVVNKSTVSLAKNTTLMAIGSGKDNNGFTAYVYAGNKGFNIEFFNTPAETYTLQYTNKQNVLTTVKDINSPVLNINPYGTSLSISAASVSRLLVLPVYHKQRQVILVSSNNGGWEVVSIRGKDNDTSF